jgi:hypothetical protein
MRAILTGLLPAEVALFFLSNTTAEYYYVGVQEMLPADDPQAAAKLTLDRIEARFPGP